MDFLSNLRSSGMLRSVHGWLPTFRDNLSFPSSMVQHSKKNAWPLKMGPIACPETSVTTKILCVKSQKTEDPIYTAEEAWNCSWIFFLYTNIPPRHYCSHCRSGLQCVLHLHEHSVLQHTVLVGLSYPVEWWAFIHCKRTTLSYTVDRH